MKNTIPVQLLHLINIMATVDSLDLASLQNNPQSIAEALEDALETTDGTIGTLKTSAQSKKDDIDDLYDDALTAKNQIDALLTASSQTEIYHTNSLLNSWTGWSTTTPPYDEQGIRIQRYGKIYVVQASMYKTSVSINSTETDNIKTLTSSDITLPTDDVILGVSLYNDTSNVDHVSRMTFKTNGNLEINYVNWTGGTMYVIGNFIGIDQG